VGINFPNVVTVANKPVTSFTNGYFTTLPTISIIDPNLNNDMMTVRSAGRYWLCNSIEWDYVNLPRLTTACLS